MYATGNKAGKPVGSGYYVVSLNAGQWLPTWSVISIKHDWEPNFPGRGITPLQPDQA